MADKNKKKTPKPKRNWFLRAVPWLLMGLVALLIFHPFSSDKKGSPNPSYNQFLTSLESGKIKEIRIVPDSVKLTVQPKKGNSYTIGYPGDSSLPKILHTAEKKNVTIFSSPVKENSVLLSVLVSFLPILLLIGIIIYFTKRSGAGAAFGFGKSPAKRYDNDRSSVTFKDIAGVDEALEEVKEIKEFLESPGKFRALGARIPRGVLLYGPSGTGKTLLAKAVAGEAGVPFYSMSGSGFQEVFVGIGAQRVRSLFQEAKDNSPAIIFIDEIDSVGRNRSSSMNIGHDEAGNTLNELLSHMDGFTANENVIIFGATNRVDVLDPALLRPGRFDRQIMVDRPDRNGREAILEVHTRGKPVDPKTDLSVVAASTPGFSGADLANVVNEAAIIAARNGCKEIALHDFQDAILRVVAGPEKKTRIISDKEKRIAAYHEVGHAVVANYLPNCDPVHKISIISRGRALGFTLSLPEEDTFLATQQELEEKIAMALGGRAAEQIIFKEVTTGASNDLEQVTLQAKRIVMRFAMTDLGLRTFGVDEEHPYLGAAMGGHYTDYSEAMARRIDSEIERITNEAYKLAQATISEHMDEVHALAKVLIDKENIDKKEFDEIIKSTTPHSPKKPPKTRVKPSPSSRRPRTQRKKPRKE